MNLEFKFYCSFSIHFYFNVVFQMLKHFLLNNSKIQIYFTSEPHEVQFNEEKQKSNFMSFFLSKYSYSYLNSKWFTNEMYFNNI